RVRWPRTGQRFAGRSGRFSREHSGICESPCERRAGGQPGAPPKKSVAVKDLILPGCWFHEVTSQLEPRGVRPPPLPARCPRAAETFARQPVRGRARPCGRVWRRRDRDRGEREKTV